MTIGFRKTVVAARAASVLLKNFALLGVAVTVLFPAEVAIAEPSRSSLTGVTVSGGEAGEIQALLSFDQMIAPYSIASNDNERATLIFPSTVKGAFTGMPSTFKGVLKAIEFTQKGADLTVSFIGDGPIHIDATMMAGRAISLSITTKIATRDGIASANGAMPVYVDAKAGEDEFEVVQLKYADVEPFALVKRHLADWRER